MAVLSSDFIRGIKMPMLVDLSSRIALGSGIGVPIPTLFWALTEIVAKIKRQKIFEILISEKGFNLNLYLQQGLAFYVIHFTGVLILSAITICRCS